MFSRMGSNHDRLNQNQKCYHYTTGKYKQIYYLWWYYASVSVSEISYIHLPLSYKKGEKTVSTAKTRLR